MIHKNVKKGLHFGLLLDMFENSHRWNLAEQYLFIAVFIIIMYRFISFTSVFLYLPRYSYSRNVRTSATTLSRNQSLLNANGSKSSSIDSADVMSYKQNIGGDIEHKHAISSLSSNNAHHKHEQLQSHSPSNKHEECQYSCFCSYSYLQLFFDIGYILELAPWLWNWEHSRIILPEFAWFCKMRCLLQSLPFSMLICTFLLSTNKSEMINNDLFIYALVSFTVSILTIVLSLFLYDNHTLNKNHEQKSKIYEVFICNYMYRLTSVISRIIILSFMIALFPWPLLFAIVLIPIVSYSGPYQLGNTDNEPLNLFYQSLLVFPDYSSPFGKIADTENFFNKLHSIHMFIVIIFGFPLLIILICVEKLVNRMIFLKEEDPSVILVNDKEKYTTFRITTYTLSRFVESLLELIIIAIELFEGREVHQRYVDYNSFIVWTLFWLALGTTLIFPLAFVKFHDQFVVDNEEDFDLSYAETHQQTHVDFIASNEQYNQDHGYLGKRASSGRTSFSVESGTINVLPIDMHGSRHYLRQKQYWIAIHQNNYKGLAWILRSRQHVNLLEVNEREQIGLIIVGIRHDWPSVRLLIEHGGGVRYLARYAALKGELDIIQYLYCDLNIDIRPMKDNFNDPLMFSAIEGEQTTILEFFAFIGFNLNERTVLGESPVIVAAKKGSLEIIEILDKSDVDLTEADDIGNTVAHYAAEIYHGQEILKYLAKKFLKKDIQIFSDDDDKEEIANNEIYQTTGISIYNTNEIMFDKNEFNFNHQNKRGMSAAYIAAFHGQVNNLRVLVKCGANVGIFNQDGNNCLIASAMNDQPSTVNFLLSEMKMDVDFSNTSLESALYWAAGNGSIGCIEVLIEHSANMEKCDKYAITPLMVAAEHGETKAVRVLLAAGANANHQNQDGETALMKACAEGFLDCVRHLIEYDADPNISDDEGNCAILWCCMTGNMQIFEYLVLDALKLTKKDIETTLNNDKESCVDWIVENQLEVGLEVLEKLGVDITVWEQDEDDGDDDMDDDAMMRMHEDDDIDLMAI